MDAPDYSGQKYGYSLSTLIICDHKQRIRHYLAGFPGSVHDNRIWKATELYQTPNSYFLPREYCVGDSAFENDCFMVSAFKKPKDRAIPEQHVKFNEKTCQDENYIRTLHWNAKGPISMVAIHLLDNNRKQKVA